MQATIRERPKEGEKIMKHARKNARTRSIYMKLLELCELAELPLNFPSDALYLLRKRDKIRWIHLEHLDSEICTAIRAVAAELRMDIDMIRVLGLAGLDEWSSMIPTWYPHLNKSRRIRERIGLICGRHEFGKEMNRNAINVYDSNRNVLKETTVSIAAAACVWMGCKRSEKGGNFTMRTIARICGVSIGSIRARTRTVNQAIEMRNAGIRR